MLVLRFIIIAFLILLDIACVNCFFEKKPSWPFLFWFVIFTIAIFIMCASFGI